MAPRFHVVSFSKTRHLSGRNLHVYVVRCEENTIQFSSAAWPQRRVYMSASFGLQLHVSLLSSSGIP